jgi:hypothetical protein
VQACNLKKASLQGVIAMQKQKEIKVNEKTSESKEKIQVIFFAPRKDYEIEMKKWERLYNDTDGWLDKDYLIVRKIDENRQ